MMRAAAAALVTLALVASAATRGAAAEPRTFAALADDAAATLTQRFGAGNGLWRSCADPACRGANSDWGTDALTTALYVRWLVTHDMQLVPSFHALATTEPHDAPCTGPPCRGWSDVPAWDAVAALRVYDVTRDASALQDARAAYARVTQSDAYAGGACPAIDYQRPHGEGGGLKTLETDANLVLAGVLLAQRTHETRYLSEALRRYDEVRRWFLDRERPLYTVYVFDDGRTCRALPGRFFASVNGAMIDAGLELARATRNPRFGLEARETARAIASLADARGIFTDLQAENDVVAPLVLAMLRLAESDAFAHDWIVHNAAAAAHARRADGLYGRFFDGPPPAGLVTAWQAAGGLALAIAAGFVAPEATVERGDPWAHAVERTIALDHLPATLRFTGSGIALFGTLGARCCEAGRARLLIDGRAMVDQTGIWQNKSSLGRSIPQSTLFAWRWPSRGEHVLRFEADASNPKEGGGFLALRRALILP